MQITTPTGTYKWIGDKWGEAIIDSVYWTNDNRYRDLIQVRVFEKQYSICTYHTPEQLVKLGYMELVEETTENKPMDKWVEEKIELLPIYEKSKPLYTLFDLQLELLTTAVNKLISFHNK